MAGPPKVIGVPKLAFSGAGGDDKGRAVRAESSPVRILAPERTASARKVAVVSRFSAEAQPKLQWPQAWPRPVLRGISPQCTPSRSRPAFRCEFALECSLMPGTPCMVKKHASCQANYAQKSDLQVALNNYLDRMPGTCRQMDVCISKKA